MSKASSAKSRLVSVLYRPALTTSIPGHFGTGCGALHLFFVDLEKAFILAVASLDLFWNMPYDFLNLPAFFTRFISSATQP